MRALLLGLILLLAMPAAAQAWYVDLSITGAGRVYETTDANELDEHCTAYPEEGFSSPGTTPTGVLGATCQAGDASGDYGSGWVVRYVAEPAAGYRFAGWQSDGRTNPGPVLCDGSEGSSNYSGSACQFATWANLQTRARFVDDTNPAMSSLTGPNAVVNGPATFTFSAASDPTFSHFECRVGGVHDWQTCSSGRQENPASSGTYTFQVRGVDRSNNRSAESTWQWTVDKIPPETSLLSGPSGVVASTSATFEFSSNESGNFSCTLDAVQVNCGSPKSYSGLGQGSHTFTVQARDVAGNLDPSPASRTWTVDTVAPGTTLASSGPTGSTTSTSAEFTFSSEPGATFKCQLDGQPVENGCVSPRSYSGLAPGSHTFKVWARDGVGNEDATPATRTWTVTSAGSGGDGGDSGSGGDSGGGGGSGDGGGSGTGDGAGSSGGNPIVADTAKPVAVLSFSKKRLARILRTGLVTKGSTTEAGRLRLDVLYKGKKVATKSRAVTGAGTVKLVAKFKKKWKRKLARLRRAKLTLRLTVTDMAGNRTVKKKTVTLRR